jgi:hypothetical protein
VGAAVEAVLAILTTTAATEALVLSLFVTLTHFLPQYLQQVHQQ